MDKPEEQKESVQGDDRGEGSDGHGSALSAEHKNQTDRSPDPVALWEGEAESQGDSLPEATIVPEDGPPPNGPPEAEKDLEENRALPKGSIELEAEPAPDPVSSPQAVENSHGPALFWWLKNHQKAVGGVLIGLCALVLFYGLGRFLTCRNGKRQRMAPVQVYWSSVETGASGILDFDRFLVLLPKTADATYLLVKMSVKPSTHAVYEEMDKKRTFCRASIYAVLSKKVHGNNRQRISIETLKPVLMDALNSTLATGTVAAIYFTEFLVV